VNERLFVYGSLMVGQPSAHLLAGAAFIGPAATTAGYTLLALPPGYPGLRPGGATSVRGELFTVGPALLERLDAFEGHPDLFGRGQVHLVGGATAVAYLMSPATAETYRLAPVVPHGDWRRFCEPRGRR